MLREPKKATPNMMACVKAPNIAMTAEMSSRGFTMIELLTAIALAAIIMGLAVPNFMDFIIRNRLNAYNNEFVAALATARSEAIRRGTTVSVCRRASDTSCVGGAWSNGWLVLVNRDNVNPTATAPSGPVIKVHEALSGGYTLNGNANYKNFISFDADGSAHQNGTFVFCRNGNTTTARTAILTRLRVRVGEGAADCVNP